MIDITQLRSFVAEGLETIRVAVVDAKILAARNEQLITRLNYASDTPCNGVHEPHSLTTNGEETVVAPERAVRRVHVEAIAEYMG